MKTQNKTIGYSQFMFLVAAFVYGSHMLLTPMKQMVKQDMNLNLIFGFLLSLPLILAFALLTKWFHGKDLIQILKAVYGAFIGRVIAALYVVFFLMLISFNLHDIASFYSAYIMPETPIMAFLGVFMLICAYAVKKGMDGVVKFSVWSAVIAFIVALGTTLLLIGQLNLNNFLPILEQPLGTYVQTASIFAVIPLGEIVVLLMVTPKLKETKNLTKYMIGGAGIAALTFSVIAFRATAVLGEVGAIYTATPYLSARMIDIGEVLTRIELLIAIVVTFGLFVKISVLYYAAVRGIAQLLPAKTQNPFILPVGIIAVVLALIAFESTVFHTEFLQKYGVFLHAPFTIVIPLVTLLVAKIRKIPNCTVHSI